MSPRSPVPVQRVHTRPGRKKQLSGQDIHQLLPKLQLVEAWCPRPRQASADPLIYQNRVSQRVLARSSACRGIISHTIYHRFLSSDSFQFPVKLLALMSPQPQPTKSVGNIVKFKQCVRSCTPDAGLTDPHVAFIYLPFFQIT